jgi:hypothetical protein
MIKSALSIVKRDGPAAVALVGVGAPLVMNGAGAGGYSPLSALSMTSVKNSPTSAAADFVYRLIDSYSSNWELPVAGILGGIALRKGLNYVR